MKKIMKIMAVLVLMTATFIAGVVWAHNHNRATLTITTCVKEDERVEELQERINELEAEHTARRVLGNDLAEDAFRTASHDGFIDYRIYADNALVASGHIPVMDNETEWMAVQRLAGHVQDHFDGQHVIKTELM